MQNQKAHYIRAIEKLLSDNGLLESQRQTLVAFDRFNELESQCRLKTRLNYLKALQRLGLFLCKPYEDVVKEDLQIFIGNMKKRYRDGMIQHYCTNLRRFYR